MEINEYNETYKKIKLSPDFLFLGLLEILYPGGFVFKMHIT